MKIIKKISIAFAIIVLIYIGKVNANVTSTDPSTSSGGEVTITLKSSEKAYTYKVSVIDAGGLTFKSATSSAGQVNGSVINGASTSGVNILGTYKFQVPTVDETKKYTVKFNVAISTDGETMQTITNTSTVTVEKKKDSTTNNDSNNNNNNNATKSSDATLKSITIGSKKYSGSSLKDTISYTANADVGTIKISAEKNNSKATISGTGTKSLKEGETNKFTITVTAENGTKKNYTVNIIRLAKENNEPNIIDERTNQEEPKQEELKLTSLVIKDVELNTEFNSDVYNYIANVKNMTQLEIDASANLEGAEIKIEGAEELKEGDNKVKIIAILGDKKVEYTIDVYNQITDEETGIVEDDNNNIDEDKTNKNFIGSVIDIVKNNLITTILASVIVILSFLIIFFAIRLNIYSKKLKILTEQNGIETVETAENNEENEEPELKEVTKKPKAGKHF